MIVYLFGDHLARQSRDPGGLALAVSDALDGAPVYDYSVEGTIRDVARKAADVLGSPAWLSCDHPERRVAVFVVGATDSRAGGPPPGDFIGNIGLLVKIAGWAGFRPVVVVSPAAPVLPGQPSPRGYAKGSRRWLKRVGPMVMDDCGKRRVVACQPVGIPEDAWGDQLTLRPSGIEAMARQIAVLVNVATQAGG